MKVLSNFLDMLHVSGFNSENLASQWRVVCKLNILALFMMAWGDGGGGISTSFSPVTSINLGIIPQKNLTFCHAGVKFQGYT